MQEWRTAQTTDVPYAFIAAMQDVSQPRQADAAPSAAPVDSQSIIDGMADPVMVIGTDYRVQLMNRAAGEFSSEDVGASEPRFCYQVSHHRGFPCNGIEHPCPLQLVCTRRRPVTVVHTHYRASGEPRFIEIVAAPLWNQDGTLRGIIESMRDITERKQVEESLRQHAERLRSVTAQLADVAETERQRLAQELHDQVGQNLSLLSINLSIIRAQIPEEAAEILHARLDDSLTLVEATAERIRDVMAELRPPVLNDYGLGASLCWYGEQFARRTNIAFSIENEEAIPRLAPRVEIALFRIAQEALTNVAKHAQATHVVVTATVDDHVLRLIIADDGIGFSPASLTKQKRGWGLLTMAERTEAVGGHFHVESFPGQGTQIVIEVDR